MEGKTSYKSFDDIVPNTLNGRPLISLYKSRCFSNDLHNNLNMFDKI
jgi:hypothetical protein